MSIHSLDLLDLPTLYRYRAEAVSLDSARTLTRGNPLGAVGFISYVNPRRHIYAAVSEDNGSTLVGGITQARGESFGKLLYLAPASSLEHSAVPALVEHLTAQAGTWGAFHVLAEVDEKSDAFPGLRMSGFSVYAWQRIWDISSIPESDSPNEWKRVRSIDLPDIQNLYHQIVPPLLQPVESTPKHAGGLICSESEKCYINTSVGLTGILLTPLIHPETADVGAKLSSLISHLPNRRGRPIYMCVRSYQAWLEPVLEDLGARPGERQAVMVKHLAWMVKEEQAVRATQPAGVSVQPSRITHAATKK
jgi:hypothetical protein